jgi:hypothetical protein
VTSNDPAWRCGCPILVLLLSLTPLAAQAQAGGDRGRNIAVTERVHKGYEPIGIRAGAFRVSPSVRLETEANDNIYATEDDPIGDLILRVTPQVSVNSGWSRHSVSATARAVANEYVEEEAESTIDYLLRVAGRLDAHSRLTLNGSAQVERLTEQRSRSEAAFQAEAPVRYERTFVSAGANYRSGRVSLGADAQNETRDYENVATRDGGLVLNDVRDVDILRTTARIGVDLSPDTAVFGLVQHNRREHRLQIGESRDSEGYRALLGANFDLTRLMRGELALGYLRQHYDDGSTTTGFAADWSVLWFPTQLTTVTFEGQRAFEESTELDAIGTIDTDVSVRIDHELRRHILLYLTASYLRSDYDGLDRTDESVSAGAGARYLLNRAASVDVRAEHYVRDSKGADRGRTYDQNRVTFGLNLRY